MESFKFESALAHLCRMDCPPLQDVLKLHGDLRFVTSASIVGPVLRTVQREEQFTEMAYVVTY